MEIKPQRLPALSARQAAGVLQRNLQLGTNLVVDRV
jgi:hypothetical protein